MKRFFDFAIGILIFAIFFGSAYAQIPDFEIDAKSITFSNPNPVEGEEIIIWIDIKNSGIGTPTMNEDLVVDLYEGGSYDPAAPNCIHKCNLRVEIG